MDTSYVNYLTVPLQSYSLHCFLLSHCCWSYHNYGFLHASLSAMQKHPSVQASPVLLEKQFCWQVDVLHLHVISSRRLTGAGAFVIGSGTRSSLSFVHPCPFSDSRSCIASRARLHTNAW